MVLLALVPHAEGLLAWHGGIDELPAEDHLTLVPEAVPGRMSSATAAAFVLSGLAIMSLAFAGCFAPLVLSQVLGLATGYGIVKRSGGCIRMESATGLGTSFEVHLPCMREEAAAMEPKSATKPVTTSASTGAILLAEDEPLVRSLLSDALRRSGYTVLEAGDGEEAMQRATEYPGTIELLVSDALMPRLSGKELAVQIHARTPGLKVLFISGYSGDSLPEGTVAAPNVSFLGKPFTPNVLVDRVRDILSGSGAGRPDRDQRPQLASPPLPA